jgi:excisionase family DNA binding protein
MNTNETPVTPFTIQIPPEFYQDLDARIKKAVAEAISGNSKQGRFLTRKETCELLNISMPTLSRYISKKLIVAQRIGNRILIDESKLKQSLQDVKLSGR